MGELDFKEIWAQKNWCFWTVVLEKTLEGPLDCKEIHLVHPKGDQSWVFIRRTDVEAETPILWPPDAKSWLTHLKRPWCWERLKAGGEGDDRGWDGWMASLTQRTWVCINSGSWWWTGRPGMLWSMGSQRVGHNWVTELNWSWTHWYVCATGRNENVSCFVESSSLWPVDCSPPGSSVHGISQARILEWVAIFFSRESSSFRNWTQFSHTAGRSFTVSATTEGPKIEEKVLISTINN